MDFVFYLRKVKNAVKSAKKASRTKGGIAMKVKSLYKSPEIELIDLFKGTADVMSLSGGSFNIDGYDDSDFVL